METAGFTDHLKKITVLSQFFAELMYFHTSKRVSVNSRLFEKMVNENLVGNFFHFETGNSLGRRCSNLMKLYMRLRNIIASTFFKKI